MIGELIPTAYTYDQGRVELNDSFSGTANLNNLLLDADFSGGTGGGVIYSGGTDLYNIFLTSAGANDITRVQPGLNTYTGGTGNEPTVNISAATLTYLSATTISGGTIYSGAANLANIFVNSVSEGSNIVVGGFPTSRTVSLNGNIHINNINFSGTGLGNSFSATTVSGGTIFSGDTNLYSIFAPIGGSGEANTASNVGSGFGLFKQKTVFDLEFRSLSAGSNVTFITGDTLTINANFSGGSGFSGLTSSTGSNSIIANNGTGTIASGTYGLATGSGTTASGFSSNAQGIAANSNNYAEWSRSSGTLGQYGFVSYYAQTQLAPSNSGQLFLDGGSLSKLFEIPVDTTYYVDVTIVARVLSNGNSATWKAEGMIKNIGGVVSIPVDTGGGQFNMNAKVLDNSFSGMAPSDIYIITGTNSLDIFVTNAPDAVVNWFAKAEYTRVN